ncbi:MAG: winged helix-turn-helix domain-containing protein [Candidatus Cloacimonetes bacterium]|nr:winged helix-turn-helix domain-containing protein [Candidatus Cloacimonadota bacterium]MCF7815166.1 winged helix-turn-helix domain-containing protein [Candidatus Cloacimonadota bacterium]MCF7869376.1 winged helix-turn-helix domain-containing protein [Candidatus Cloacimonadota bacterium]MCF7884778.1 winged helix-turn-helix domain-containing protein [Candidatus Cloacimonadota bacterium]
MLENLLGSINKERVLIFLYCREEGYAKEIADFFEAPLTPILNQLNNLENGNILISQSKGRTKIFQLNPRYPFLKELKNLLEKTLAFYPDKERDLLINNRRRPRRNGKNL